MGALWKKSGRSQTFLSGQIKLNAGTDGEELVRILVFDNSKNKKSDNAPDFVIYKSEDRREQSSDEQNAASETETAGVDGLL